MELLKRTGDNVMEKRKMAIVSKLLMLFSIVCVTGFTKLHSQEHTSKWKAGAIYGYGVNDFFSLIEHNYNYKLHLIRLNALYRIKSGSNWDFYIEASPQFNFTSLELESSKEQQKGIEFGLNLGISFHYKVKSHSIYGLISAGPHYINRSLERQINGFIFSDNFEIGSLISTNQSLYIKPSIGFRHISNASIKSPNGGINNFIYSLGVLKSL